MRVLEVITGGEPGGAQRHVRDLSLFLVQHSHSVMIVHGGGNWLSEQLSGTSVAVQYLSDLTRSPSPRRDLQAIRALRQLIAQWRPDVVHCHSSKAGIIGRWVAYRVGVPAVYTAHGYVFSDPTKRRWERALYRQLEKWSARHSHGVITMTAADRRSAQAFVGQKRVWYIPNGVEILDEPRPVRLSGPPTAGFMGRLTREKGLDTLSRVASHVADWNFVIAGTGPEEGTVRRMRDASSRIKWLGWVEGSGEPFWQEIDVLIQPSWKEGAPYTILDAMARGIPVVASRVGAIPDMLEGIDSSMVVESGDVRGFAHALQRVYTHRERLGQACYQAALTRFSIEAQHRATYQALRQVAKIRDTL